MPYGEGRSKQELKKIARDYARTDDTKIYEVTTLQGTKIKVSGINSAKAVAGKDGTYEETV